MIIRQDMIVTALSSVIHGGERLSTTTLFRRQRYAQPDGTTVEVPVISGNAVRGVWRRHAAAITWEALGKPRLPLSAAHAILSGGTLAKTSSPMTPEQRIEIQKLVPIISLFGGAGGGELLPGRFNMGHMVPIVAETVHVLPSSIKLDRPPESWRKVVGVEEFSRMDEADLAAGMAHLDGADANTQQMRYGVETLNAGTRMWWSLHTEELNAPAAALLGAVVAAWRADGATVGGRASAGHGRIDTSALVIDDTTSECVEYHRDNAAAITEALGWLS